ncbi:MAG: DDE-type integrase/transposase/recombinase, partial [Desulfobacterales bacterium]|nr:DDE-type integrase/transposase/recombinase [Desulfobacterales bacterium]
MTEKHCLSISKACFLIGISRSSYYYVKKPNYDEKIKIELNRLAEKYPRYGFGKMLPILKREGFTWGSRRVCRVYRKIGLNLRSKRKKRFPKRISEKLNTATQTNDFWAMDFMSDSLTNGRVFRILNVIDEYNRECLSISIDRSLPGQRVVRELNKICKWRGYPRKIRLDNGPEFISKKL